MKKFPKLILSLIFSIIYGGMSAQERLTAEQVVQEQLEAYNKRDINRFIETFHPEAELWDYLGKQPKVRGLNNVKAIYAQLFQDSPELHSELLNRIVIGNKVIDYEKITGRQGQNEALLLVMVYEIKDGLIFRATAIRED
ncbi:MAG: nuclear transport factor 2 family protein [Cyclobacteriaceae bacterium]|nr:nuclear transport factor 2 family protein [Cyclobacteriaceae bacterium]MCH8515049.1 nuclear transport factor 2 family protein [Cyclobacteriaceae bacterium]